MSVTMFAAVERQVGGAWVDATTTIMPPGCDDTMNGYPAGPYLAWDRRYGYGVFDALAGTRDADIQPIKPLRGLPSDLSASVRAGARLTGHHATWLTVSELLTFDWDRLVDYVEVDDADDPATTYRDLVGAEFLDEIRHLADAGANRIVMWFDF